VPRGAPVDALLAEEETLNAARLGGGLGYSPSRHVQVMSALMRAARSGGPDAPEPQMKASGISALRSGDVVRSASSMAGSSIGAW
jgi:hypothetical protein